MAAEDAEFDTHMGLSITRIIVTLATRSRSPASAAGASTLTQQLTRKLFLNDDKTWERKIKEAVLAIQIEKRYTKPEIVTLYCNQIPWGHGTYGVEAAARLYFGKSAKDVTLEEAALLAGIIQAPARHSPYVNLPNACAAATTRSARWPTPASSPASAPSRRRRRRSSPSAGRAVETDAAFFVEEVRQQLEERYGAQQLYENGLAVYTTLDLKLQHAAEAALADGHAPHRSAPRLPQAAAHRRGRRSRARRSELDALDREGGRRRWAPRSSPSSPASTAQGPRARRRAPGELGRADYAWTGKTTGAFLAPGDVVRVLSPPSTPRRSASPARSIRSRSSRGRCWRMNNRTGRVLAMVGGRSFEQSRFNRTTQAMRQLGSTFKPIVYATAIDRGFTPVSILQDSPGVVVGRGRPAALPAAQLRQEVRGPDHAAARPRAVAQRARRCG